MATLPDRQTLSAAQTAELVTRLTSFLRLHGRLRGRLQSFTPPPGGRKDEAALRGLLAVCGGVLGATCGGAVGGCWGAAGAASTATVVRFCGDISAVEASAGLVGGVCGAAVGSAAELRRGRSALSDAAWFAIGFATGGAIGGVFGDAVGAAGGAFGGGFGALHAARFAVALVGGVAGVFCEAKRSDDFGETIEPLLEELQSIKTVCVTMASSVVARGLADQAAASLASAIERNISGCQRAADPTLVGCDVEEATKKVVDDLEATRAEVEKLLFSLSDQKS